MLWLGSIGSHDDQKWIDFKWSADIEHGTRGGLCCQRVHLHTVQGNEDACNQRKTQMASRMERDVFDIFAWCHCFYHTQHLYNPLSHFSISASCLRIRAAEAATRHFWLNAVNWNAACQWTSCVNPRQPYFDAQTWRADQDLQGGSGLNIFLINSHEALFQHLDITHLGEEKKRANFWSLESQSWGCHWHCFLFHWMDYWSRPVMETSSATCRLAFDFLFGFQRVFKVSLVLRTVRTSDSLVFCFFVFCFRMPYIVSSVESQTLAGQMPMVRWQGAVLWSTWSSTCCGIWQFCCLWNTPEL